MPFLYPLVLSFSPSLSTPCSERGTDMKGHLITGAEMSLLPTLGRNECLWVGTPSRDGGHEAAPCVRAVQGPMG